MGFSIERGNFSRILATPNAGSNVPLTNDQRKNTLLASLIRDLVDNNGATLVYWHWGLNPNATTNFSGSEEIADLIIFDLPNTVNPLDTTQPVRIALRTSTVSNAPSSGAGGFNQYRLSMHVGTPFSIPIRDLGGGNPYDPLTVLADNNTTYNDLITNYITYSTGPNPYGYIVPPEIGGSNDPNFASYIDLSTPWGYRLSITNRGIGIIAWQQSSPENMDRCGLCVVQRPVDCDGNALVTGKAPVYFLNNFHWGTGQTNAGTRIPRNTSVFYVYTVRESDVESPETVRLISNITSQAAGVQRSVNRIDISAGHNQDDSGRVLHGFPMFWQTPVTADTGEYVLVFPVGICTNRFAYVQEMDMIAVSKDEAYQLGQVVPITVYGDDREYTAYSANTEIRLFLVSSSVDEGF